MNQYFFLFKVINGREFAKDSVVRKYNVIPDLSIYPVKAPGSSQWPDPSEGEREIWRNDSSFNSKAGFPIKTNSLITDALLACCCAMLCVLGFGIIKSRELVFFRRVVNIEK